MKEHKIDFFERKAKPLFKNLIDDFGYILTETNIYEINGEKWSIHLIYLNNNLNLKIEIQQAPYYSDYGFTFSIYKMGTDEYNILYNVPHEKQDIEGNFLLKAHEELFSNLECLNLIKGTYWIELKHIVFEI